MKSNESTQEQESLTDIDVSRKDFIEIEIPSRKKRVMITVTRRHFYDEIKQKIVTDQILHKAVYGQKKEVKNDRKGSKKSEDSC